jgi:preprotein translocase SecF subunit
VLFHKIEEVEKAMFNLVGKRYIFLGISLLVIIPGVISLIFKGMNVGIDFSGGTSFEFRPQVPYSGTLAVQKAVHSFGLSELQVVLGNDAAVQANQSVWIRLNTQIDTNVQNAIKTDITDYYGGNNVNVQFDDLVLNPIPGSGQSKAATVTVVTLAFKNVTPNVSKIESLLAHLPDTSNPARGPATSTPTPTSTPAATTTPKATSTPKATVTPATTPKATTTPTTTPSTPVVGVSPTPTPATTTSNPANIPVKVVKVYQGTTTQTVTLLTLTFINQAKLLQLKAALANQGNYIYVLDNATVSGSVASETTRNAFLAVLAAAFFILLYIWFAFRKVNRPWRYGTCAIIALLHDVLVVLGIFSILGWAAHVQIDSLFITAVLTVCGFSVHDTIVVFDRIRENMQRRSTETFEQVVNASLVQTMTRSLNTSFTVLITLMALTLFGGETIRTFTLALLIGIFSGTYSSIFNASMLLVMWERGELGFNRLKREREPERRPARELARTR